MQSYFIYQDKVEAFVTQISEDNSLKVWNMFTEKVVVNA